jgi:hypothetical protein
LNTTGLERYGSVFLAKMLEEREDFAMENKQLYKDYE